MKLHETKRGRWDSGGNVANAILAEGGSTPHRVIDREVGARVSVVIIFIVGPVLAGQSNITNVVVRTNNLVTLVPRI